VFLPPQRIRGKLDYDLIRLPDRRYTFHTDLLQSDDRLIVVADQVSPSKPVVFRGEEVFGSEYWVVWFLYKNQPWDLGRVYRPDGTFTGYYADVLEPVRWEGDDPTTVEPIVDLFLDLWIAPDGSYQALDEDELEEAVRKGIVSPERERRAQRVLTDLIERTEKGEFPPAEVKRFTD
jgi:predicted RNA-binding protein associated with RNAse of E/G family